MASASSNAVFFIWAPDRTLSGPVDLPALINEVRAGRVSAETWIFANRSGVWLRGSEVPDLRRVFQVRPPQPAGEAIDRLGLDPSLLGHLKLFAGMTPEQLERFLEFVEVQRVPLWSTIVKQGDRGDAMYVILEGELTVRMNVVGKETTQTTLATLGAGDFFGDIALFDDGPRSADVVAGAGSILLKISAAAFDEMSRHAPEVATPFLRALGKTLTARIRAGNKHLGEAVMMSRALQ
jgi:CRP/FNR family transcriptional regulator, cyclic AMP receptor protein